VFQPIKYILLELRLVSDQFGDVEVEKDKEQ
jgi:hypothetical protein